MNPAVTCSMCTLNKISHAEAVIRIAGQMSGGLMSFPFCFCISEKINLIPFGGPEFEIDDDAEGIEAFLSEFGATFLLCLVICTVNWEINFGPCHCIIKQSLAAIAMRASIEHFPTAGKVKVCSIVLCFLRVSNQPSFVL